MNIITDRQTGRPKGFAFVEMATPEAADAAKTALNGTELDGRTINVDNAREQEPRRPGGFGGGRRLWRRRRLRRWLQRRPFGRFRLVDACAAQCACAEPWGAASLG